MKKIQQMFSSIAPRYDLLNHLLSLGFDFRWRRKVALETVRPHCTNILDICTGTGDMAFELCRFWNNKAHIEAVDFSQELLSIGREKLKKYTLNGNVTFREADAENLPYTENHFDAVTVAFGLRNIHDKKKALEELYRVTKHGGNLVCLEFSQPKNPILRRLYFFYLLKFVPLLSYLCKSNPEAYRYLGRTIKEFYSPQELNHLIESAGWRDVSYACLTGGIVAIHKGTKG